jgi:flagellar basal-body rod modification protein FlgD
MDISSISSIDELAGAAAGAGEESEESLVVAPEDLGLEVGAPGGVLGKNEFLTLLTTQMQNQDPLDPVDNTEMVAQLAQFSSLEQMQNLNETASAYIEQSGLASALNMSWLLGGQTVNIEFINGQEMEGTVERVMWVENTPLIQVGEQYYKMSDISSISKVEESEEGSSEETTTEGSTTTQEGAESV